MLNLHLNIRGLSSAQNKIAAIRLHPSERKQINRAMGRKVASYSKKRITQQQTLSGERFSPRKRGRKKMLQGLKRRMRVKNNLSSSTVTWQGGKVAYKHQHGWKESMTAKKMQENEKRRNPNNERSTGGMATRSQAKALLAAGYFIPKNQNNGRKKRPTQKWIMGNISKNQAGLLIRLLKNQPTQNRWTINLPSRTFLGVTDQQSDELMDYLHYHVRSKLSML